MSRQGQGQTVAIFVMVLLAACSESSGLGANSGRDAAVAGSGGASAHGGSGADGGARGSGGATGMGGRTGSTAAKTGSGGSPGTGGMGADAAARDASTSFDVPAELPRVDASSPDRAAQDAVADAGRGDALSAAAQEYVETFAEPYCTRLAECCAEQGLPTPGLGACEAHELGFVKYLDDGSTVIDTTTIETVLAQLENSCDQPSYVLLGSTTQGTRLSGEPCASVSQCAGDTALCLSSSGSASGKCMTPPRGKAGDGCSVTCDDATLCKWGTSGGKSPYSACYEQDGLRCDTDTQTCVPLTAPGAACTSFAECGTHADCTQGTCQAKQPLGADCSNGKYCDRGLQCMSDGGSGYACKKVSIAWSGSCSP